MAKTFKITSPVKMYLIDFDKELTLLNSYLTYIDKKVDYEIKNFIKNKWFRGKYGEEAYQERLAVLKASKTKTLLNKDEVGYWTYTGLLEYLLDKYPDSSVVSQVTYPDSKALPWDKMPEYKLRDYQEKVIDLLVKAKHGAVEAATGSGKSHCLINLVKYHGLKSLIVTPSISIADQIYKDALRAFGKKYVGKYYGGKKEPKKKVVVAVAQSLTKIEPGSPDWIELGATQVLLNDEAHLVAAQTLSELCFGLIENAPYRYFVSGTQMRGDGLDLLLEAVTGRVVFRLSVKELVEQGHLSRPSFRIIRTDSSLDYEPKDPNDFTRKHLYYNKKVNKIAAELANRCVAEGKPVLILIDEIEQFSHLLPHLKYSAGFAHGGLTKENKGTVPAEYQDNKVSPNELVKRFNANDGTISILIGTSAISTGTDIQAAKCVIFLKGGKSEIELRQSIGRGTRKTPTKSEFTFYDFDVVVNGNLSCTTHRHALQRKKIYEAVYPDVKEINLI